MKPRGARIVAIALLGAVAAPLGLVLGGALGQGMLASLGIALAVAGAVVWYAAHRIPGDAIRLDEMARSFVVLVLLGAVGATLGLAGLGVFIHDAGHSDFVRRHHGDFGVRHNCFTAYIVAACYERDGFDNVYDWSRWREKKDTAIHASLGDRFGIDMYPYPPTLMALQRGMLAVSEDFFVLRRWWYLVVAGTLLWGLAKSVAWCGAFQSNRALLLLPWLLVAPSALTGLQIQNIHPLVVALSVLAAIAFHDNRTKVGSLLLATAIVCKIWPGLLLVPLVVAGRWRAVIGTLAATVVLVTVGIAVLGMDVHRDFVTFQIPRLHNGEAFSFMGGNARPIMANVSVFSVTHKLHELKVLAQDPPLMNGVIGWSYSALTLLAAVLLGRALRSGDAGTSPHGRLRYLRGVLALLVLAQMRSPFLPWPYGVITGLWLIVFCAPGASRLRGSVLAAAFVVLAVYVPFSNGITDFAYAWGIAGTAVLLVLAAAVVAAASVRRQSLPHH